VKKVETVVFPSVEPISDKLYRVSDAIASLIPTGSNILQALLTPPYERRLENWCAEVTEAVNTLITQQNLSIEDIKSNEQFIEFLLSLTQTAAKTSQKEKLTYLRKVLINSTVVEFDDQEESSYYLTLIDSFSVAHILVLITYSGVIAGCKDEYERLNSIPNYIHKPYIYKHILSDLISKDLIIVRPDNSWGMQVYRSPVGNKIVQLLTQ